MGYHSRDGMLIFLILIKVAVTFSALINWRIVGWNTNQAISGP